MSYKWSKLMEKTHTREPLPTTVIDKGDEKMSFGNKAKIITGVTLGIFLLIAGMCSSLLVENVWDKVGDGLVCTTDIVADDAGVGTAAVKIPSKKSQRNVVFAEIHQKFLVGHT